MTLKSSNELTSVKSSDAGVSSSVFNAGAGVGRRRLLRAGLASTPVILALTGRSAMATGSTGGNACPKGLSPLAWSSLTRNTGSNCVTTSHTVQGNVLCKSPGFWKPNGNGHLSGAWPAAYCKPYSTYQSGDQPNCTTSDARWATGTTFGTCFPASNSSLKTKSVSRILLDNSNDVEFHLCAAYLNARTYAGYSMTVQEVRDLEKGILGTMTGLSQSQIRSYCDQTWA
jgi:hypothetical protein